MFTGIVEEMGKIVAVRRGAKSSVLSVQGNAVFADMREGDSIAVNGVCLTVTSLKNKIFTADVMGETLQRSSLSRWEIGSMVNLERAMIADGRFGGHIVSGHVDGLGKIVQIRKEDNATWFTVEASEKIMKYMIEKGSVTIDGISLTVAKVEKTRFSVSVIPHTKKTTIFNWKKVGDTVNLEADMMGKYMEKLLTGSLESKQETSRITMEMLGRMGF